MFNFDDLGDFAEYEPLENTLIQLRDLASISFALEKLLTVG